MVKGKAKLLKNSGDSYSAMDNCDYDIVHDFVSFGDRCDREVLADCW